MRAEKDKRELIVTYPQQVANGWRACGLMKKKF